MELLYAVIAGLVVFLLFMAFFPKAGKSASYARTRKALDRIYEEQETITSQSAHLNVSVVRGEETSGARLLRSIPFLGSYYDLLLRSGVNNKPLKFIVSLLLVFVALFYVCVSIMQWGAIGILAAIVLTIYLSYVYLKRQIEKRNEAFLNMFPDAIDMIVRSVRTGHPFNAALRMIVENMDPPISTEFKQVVDEVAYGRNMTDALVRLSKRIDEPDLHFFVVILSVQQETGGNLAEVLSNLSGVIRKRKQLRQKINAMTSEGRVTSWILGSLPVFVVLAIQFTTPRYLEPLYTTTQGNIILGVAVGMILLAFWIVRKMVRIDI